MLISLIREVAPADKETEYYDLEVNAPEHDFTTIHGCVKNSELAEFEYQGLGPEELIDSSLFRAVHPDARVFLVLESTALGMNNW